MKKAFILLPSYTYPDKQSALAVDAINRLFPVRTTYPVQTRVYTGAVYCETGLSVQELLTRIQAAVDEVNADDVSKTDIEAYVAELSAKIDLLKSSLDEGFNNVAASVADSAPGGS